MHLGWTGFLFFEMNSFENDKVIICTGELMRMSGSQFVFMCKRKMEFTTQAVLFCSHGIICLLLESSREWLTAQEP